MKANTTLYIKNMVCPRCIKVVREELTKLGLDVRSVVLGEVEVAGDTSVLPYDKLKTVLHENGFELIEDKRAKIFEKIKHAVLKLVQNDEEKNPIRKKHSAFIAEEVGQDYTTLSSLFSSVEGITLEHYIILQKIERVKELLKYDELSLSEISYKMGYSSVAHVSSQFKKVTGMTPREFKNLGGSHRHPIDHVGHDRH
ncbi:MAG: AraC family transcriptional regulator [Ignavibacteriae bacterium]|nr:AraC family transcriptional regulator [Ignavibacteriota bacterium]MCI0707927.1 AraC family transcriptional regulator [Ignavibacteriota bacterium]